MMVLTFIHLWGVALRWYVWFQKGGLYSREGNVDIDDYLVMSRWLWSGNFQDLFAHRPTQLLYPLLLSPIYWFGISEQIYVFFLHTCFALLMIFFAYKIGTRLAGRRYGYLVAFMVASYQPSFSFFNWMFTDTFYYMAVTAFVLFTLFCWEQRLTWPLWLGGGVLFLVKPESIAPLAVAVTYRQNRRVVMGIALAVLLCVVLVFSFRPTRMALLSHVHVAHGLWLSTHTLINTSRGEQYDAYEAAKKLGTYRGYTGNTALAVKALDIIRENPGRYFLKIPVRWVALWYPALFHTRASLLWRVKDLSLCLFATLGGLLCFFLQSGPRRGVAAIGLAMTLFVACYINDGDLRFRIPVLLVFLTVSPLGWNALYQRLKFYADRLHTDGVIPIAG